MLTDISLRIQIVKKNKFHEIFFRNILNPLMPKIPKWSQNLTANDLEPDYKS